MPNEVHVVAQVLLGYLLTVARIGAVMVTLPLPGLRQAGGLSRLAFSMIFAVAMYPTWPTLQLPVSPLELLSLTLRQMLYGSVLGLCAGMLMETIVLATQFVGHGAGFSYASTIDPTSEADSSVLQAIAQLTAGILFLSAGLDRQLILALAAAPQQTAPQISFAAVSAFGTEMWVGAVRLALPIVTLLILTDLAIGLFGRIHAQLQLLTVALPLKILATLGLLALFCANWSQVFSGRSLTLVR